MKPNLPTLSIEGFLELLRRSRLLPDEDFVQVEARVRQRAAEGADLQRATRWIVRTGFLTQYQLAMLLHGHLQHLFLGPFRLLDRIGKGDLAVVFKALDPSSQVVALKVLAPSKARDPNLFARFRREAEVACHLRHPNVVRALKTGEVGEVHYLVLEYLEGENLQELLARRGKLTAEELVHVGVQTLRGLHYLFEQGLVHRNLQPANLMLHVPEGRGGGSVPVLNATLKILDTSLSRSFFEQSLDDTSPRLTHEGQLLGSPDYLAPEQARDARQTDIRADIYSLGCILYHAAAGWPPFQDRSPVSVVIRHATEMPRPLPEFRPDLPPALVGTIERMLAKDPAQRFPDPAAAAAALAGEIATVPDIPLARPVKPAPEPVAPPPPPPPETSFSAFDLGPTSPAPLPFPEPIAIASPQPNPPQEVFQFEPLPPAGKTLNPGLLLLLGALGLLAVQLLAWFLAYLLHSPPNR